MRLVNFDKAKDPWPEAISDGLTLKCANCGIVPKFDYRIKDSFWMKLVPKEWKRAVICLKCFEQLALIQNFPVSALLEGIEEIQYTGSKATLVLKPDVLYVWREEKAGEGKDDVSKDHPGI